MRFESLLLNMLTYTLLHTGKFTFLCTLLHFLADTHKLTANVPDFAV